MSRNTSLRSDAFAAAKAYSFCPPDEQLIMSGVNEESLNDESPSKVFDEVKKFCEKYTFLYPMQVVRVLGIYISYYKVKDKKMWQSMVDKLAKAGHEEFVDCLTMLWHLT